MYAPRHIRPAPGIADADGLKLYAISIANDDFDPRPFIARLAALKAAAGADWPNTPAFAIFHQGASLRYLALCWWGNDNELFNIVSVEEPTGWIEDSKRYSFCVWDLEVFWSERASYIRHMYSGERNLEAYRQDRTFQTDAR